MTVLEKAIKILEGLSDEAIEIILRDEDIIINHPAMQKNANQEALKEYRKRKERTEQLNREAEEQIRQQENEMEYCRFKYAAILKEIEQQPIRLSIQELLQFMYADATPALAVNRIFNYGYIMGTKEAEEAVAALREVA